ncbi:MAG TPA: prephenate dehydratase domain-containing protein [Victivallales bacterium]|nr:prephenate dehydratase domain-containing protein [Victivallales bacterium]
MTKIKAAYLGPEGTYSHLTAKQYFDDSIELVPLKSIIDIFSFIAESKMNRGIVPVENSSGGPIAETVDLLINNNYKLNIDASIHLKVKLALLGRKNEEIKYLYSHSVPLYHCNSWIRRNLPDSEKNVVSSTAKAAEIVSSEKNSAAIASISASKLYSLDVIKYPIEQDIPNITQFFILKQETNMPSGNNVKTSISAFLNNTPGSLYEFLEPFKLDKVNLCRIISRPIYGKPSEYAFFVDIEGNISDPKMKITIDKISKACSSLNLISSYKSEKTYDL